MSTHLSTLQLHKLRNGEIAPNEAANLRAHIDTCASCAERLRHQEAERAAFVLEPVPAAIQALASKPRRRFPIWGWLAPAIAAAAAVIIVAVPWDRFQGSQGEREDIVRLKGSLAALEVVAERDGQNVLLAPGSVVIPGDRLQMKFDPGDHAYAAFAGRDGTGVVQVYRVIRTEPGGLRPAPFALELDETPGDQELFVVFTDETPDPVWLVDVIENGASAAGAVVTSIHLRKEIHR